MSGAPVGLICALPEEETLLTAALEEPTLLAARGLEARRGRLDGHAVVVAPSGVGKVRAATTATLLVERLGCRALVLSGVAGALDRRLRIGRLVVASRIVDIDYGRVTDAGRIAYQPGTLPLPEVEPDPGFRLDPALERRVRGRLTESGLKAELGTVLTGDAFLASPRVRDELATKWQALAIEMEGSAVCDVAERLGLPWLVVRALSDLAGEDSATDFRAFLASAAAASARLVRALLPVFDD